MRRMHIIVSRRRGRRAAQVCVPILGRRNGQPIVPAEYRPGEPWGSLVVTCPFCGETHWHGGRRPDEPVGTADGHRNEHCYTPEARDCGGYYVQEVAA